MIVVNDTIIIIIIAIDINSYHWRKRPFASPQ